MHGTLFETAEDRAANHIYDLLRDGSPDGLQPSGNQRALLRIILGQRGRAHAISIGRLAEMLRTTPREIKSDVRDLRIQFRVRIGSSRDGQDGGYYLITNKDEALDTARPFIQQAKAEFEIARAILEPHELKELEGQLRFTALPSAEDLDAIAAEQRAREATAPQEVSDAPLA